jgi:pantetheine-phosphate adenylyltransferase
MDKIEDVLRLGYFGHVVEFKKYFPILEKYDCSPSNIKFILDQWNKPFRTYHNLDHLAKVLSRVEQHKMTHLNMDEGEYDAYVLAAFFHDAIYFPWASDNEEKSAALFINMCNTVSYGIGKLPEVVHKVYAMIMDTKDHTKKPSSEWSRNFLEFDIHTLVFGNLSEMIDDEKKIFREFGFVDFGVYKQKRIEILEKFERSFQCKSLRQYIDWCKNVNQPKIAVYPGTFMPFHNGHKDILEKAERIFDKVIILMGFNPDKGTESRPQPYMDKIKKHFPNNQVEHFSGMLHEYINSLPYPVTLVKGLRSEYDFKLEKVQHRFMEDYKKDLQIVYILGDRKNEIVSSGAIKSLRHLGADTSEYIHNDLLL